MDGRTFIPPHQLSRWEFDYILPLSFRETTLAAMEQGLMRLGIPREKIVRPLIFLHQNTEKMQLDLVAEIQENFHRPWGVIFGLSYSLRGIHKDTLCRPFYDCSWHGLDLYYNYRLFQYIAANKDMSAVQIALLIIPYNYFSYDQSRSLFQYTHGLPFAVRQLDDWHNSHMLPEAAEYIANYRMFGSRVARFYHSSRFEDQNQNTYQGPDGGEALPSSWAADRRDTVEEYAAIFLRFITELRGMGIGPQVVVPPFYTAGMNQEARELLAGKRAEFYGVLDRTAEKTGAIPVFDYTDRLSGRRELFSDLTHLNAEEPGSLRGSSTWRSWAASETFWGLPLLAEGPFLWK